VDFIAKEALFDAISEPILAKYGINNVNNSSDSDIDNAFEAASNDPYLAKLLIEANPNMENEFSSQNAVDGLFNSDGQKVDGADPLT